MAKFNLPSDPTLAKTVVENDAAHTAKKLEKGIIGWLLGDSQEKPGNVAGIVAVFSFVAICYIIIWGKDSQSFTQKEQELLLLSVLTSSMSYLFGERSGQRRK